MAELCAELFRLFALGQLSGTEVARLASAAWKDGWGRGNPHADRMRRCGESRWSSNCHRAVMLAAQSFIGTPNVNPYIVQLDDGFKLHVFLPHEIVAALVRDEPAKWCLSIDRLQNTGMGGLLQEWASDDAVQFEGDLTKVPVLGFHADGVQYTSSMRAGGAKSVLVASLNIVSAAEDKLRQKRMLLFVISKARMCKCSLKCSGFCTMQKIFDVIAWSMKAAAAQSCPTCRHDGSEWTPHDLKTRMRGATPPAALLQVRGDWEGLVSHLRLRFYTSEHFCWMCNTTKSAGSMCFHNFKENSAHRNSLISHRQYIEGCAAEAQQPSHIFRCPGLQLRHVVVDSMHAADLGTFCDAVGSLFFIEISTKDFHRTNTAGLKSLNSRLKNFYRLRRQDGLTRIDPLSMSQIRASKPGQPPFLKAKAAQVRHVAEFALQLAYVHLYGEAETGRQPFSFRPSSRMAAHTRRHLELLVLLFQSMDKYIRSLPEPFDPAVCKAAMMQYLETLEDLHKLWRNGAPEHIHGALPFQVRPKAHVLEHLVLDQIQVFGSPAKFWCYRDEDYVGSVKSICSKTKHPSTLEVRVVQKLQILEGLNVFV